MKLKIATVIVVGVLTTTSAAFGLVFGSSNFGFGGYPEQDCYKPSFPYSRDEFVIDSFRRDVNTYIRYVNDYVEAGDNNLKRIRESQDKTTEDAKRFLADIKLWSHR